MPLPNWNSAGSSWMWDGKSWMWLRWSSRWLGWNLKWLTRCTNIDVQHATVSGRSTSIDVSGSTLRIVTICGLDDCWPLTVYQQMTEAPSTISDQLGRKHLRSTTIRCSVTRPYKSWTIWSRRNLILPGCSLEQRDNNKMIKLGTEVNNHLVHILSQSSMMITNHPSPCFICQCESC